MQDIYQKVTDKIVEAIESGTAPWSKPWNIGGIGGSDRNAITGHQYRGINTVLLWIAASEHKFTSPLWLTFKQARSAGGAVRKGEKGTHIVFWKQLTIEDKATGKPTTIPMARSYCIFNIDQTDNVKLPSKHVVEPVESDPIDPVDHIDALMASLGVDLRHGGSNAFYQPANDYVQMPDRDAFHNADLYYSTLLHEVTHWTGHQSRLDRHDKTSKFGTESYAFEELIAEIGSAMTSTVLGLDVEGYRHAASYVQSWLKVLKNDNKAIFKAASLAQKSSDYILTSEQEAQRAA